jgi:hypothetical protein
VLPSAVHEATQMLMRILQFSSAVAAEFFGFSSPERRAGPSTCFNGFSAASAGLELYWQHDNRELG